jgi:hypothetical protein
MDELRTTTVDGPNGRTYPPPPSPTGVHIPPLSRRGVPGVWAAAAVPMGPLAWVVAPLVADRLSGPGALARALIASLTAGLVWQFVLVVVLVRREQGTLRWPVVREALWLRSRVVLDALTLALALPSRYYHSALIGIAVHSAQSVFICALVLPVVLAG